MRNAVLRSFHATRVGVRRLIATQRPDRCGRRSATTFCCGTRSA